MDKRRNKKYSNNWNNQRKGDSQNKDFNNTNKRKAFQFDKSQYEDSEGEKERLKNIQRLKARQVICPLCNQPITDLASAMTDKESGNPVHFECALEKVKSQEKTGENEKIAYIGQGRFAVIFFENPRDQRHFTIKKIIEWEDREQKSAWRDEISGLYSQVN